jgi:superfamily I DNA/RNA helicase
VYEKIVDLTKAQTKILKQLKEHKRLLVLGCAGSGKTTLALHKAKTLAEAGKNVLLICYNIPLGKFLAKECAGFSNITAGPFLQMCCSWLRKAGVDYHPTNTDEWWSVEFPNLIVKYIKKISVEFDAIIVDEGQDFKEDQWTAIELLLANDKKGIFYIFADSNQNIYKGCSDYPITTAPLILDRNMRNTNQVFNAMTSCCNLEDEVEPSGVDGPRVELLEYTDETDMKRQITELLKRFVKEGVAIRDIAVLGTKAQTRTGLKHGTKIGPFSLTDEIQDNNELLTMTVHRFKGLDSKIVIICELEGWIADIHEILYIGMTRPTTLLVLLVNKSFVPTLKKMGFHN